MWRNDDCPCKPDCPDRVPDPNCHGYCEKYKAWVAKRAEEKKTYAVQIERRVATHAGKRAVWLYRNRRNTHVIKKFSG